MVLAVTHVEVLKMKFVAPFAILFSASLALAQGGATNVSSIPTALQDYVDIADDAFHWELVKTTPLDVGRVYELRLTSQKWHGIVWKHAVEIYEPAKLQFPKHALLFVTGGATAGPPGEKDIQRGLKLASTCGARVVMLHQTPNQPLLGNRKEDDLITETWLRYLDTGDETWPLLFPMVKSAVKTMDAVQELSRSKFSHSIDQFVITGASKRGWTSWLTPVADQRVIATAPIVIDVLNFRAQMNHQLETWGSFSEQIIDYTSKGLVKRPDEAESHRESALRIMMDPYTYRKKLTLPKLLVVGTNDPYWVVDAMNQYWDDLEGRKYIRQVPNAGHGLEGGQDGALTTLAIFFRHVVSAQALPDLSWKLGEGGGQLTLTMSATATPRAVRFWTARSDDTDFRDERWSSSELVETDSAWVGIAERRKSEHVAVFGEMEFDFSGHPWSLTTLVYRR
jgi:PhoPQ-activated pathogenicity-related protein